MDCMRVFPMPFEERFDSKPSYSFDVSTPLSLAAFFNSVAAETIVVRASTSLKLMDRTKPCNPTRIFSSVFSSSAIFLASSPSSRMRWIVVDCLAMLTCWRWIRFSNENISVNIPAVSATQLSPRPSFTSTLSSVGSTWKKRCLSACSALGRSRAS